MTVVNCEHFFKKKCIKLHLNNVFLHGKLFDKYVFTTVESSYCNTFSYASLILFAIIIISSLFLFIY